MTLTQREFSAMLTGAVAVQAMTGAAPAFAADASPNELTARCGDLK
jgi:hypothetical protein